MKLKIKVTKEHLRQSKDCNQEAYKNCAIAWAVRYIFPIARVYKDFMMLLTNNECIDLPKSAQDFIADFDTATPEERLQLPEIEFEVDLPQEVIDRINIEDIYRSENLGVVCS